tara:strand:+ start:307 stop:819 length:513 start_codon:yes stop_codon:yes gene_type:complete
MTTQGITDLTIIRQSLKGCEEITLPFKFPKQCWVKYITINGEDESFYEGGVFQRMGNQKVFLKNGKSTMRVPTCIKSDEGEVIYRSRFFIDPNFKSDCEVKKGQLEKTVQAQQKVIEKMSTQLKLLEESKQNLQTEYYDLMTTLNDKEEQINELLTKEKKYKLILSQYIN